MYVQQIEIITLCVHDKRLRYLSTRYTSCVVVLKDIHQSKQQQQQKQELVDKSFANSQAQRERQAFRQSGEARAIKFLCLAEAAADQSIDNRTKE